MWRFGRSDGDHGGSDRRPARTPALVSDKPVDSAARDRLGFVVQAESITDYIEGRRVQTPMTIAITAPVGAGKTTLANLVAECLEQRSAKRGEPPHVVCWLDAGGHKDTSSLRAAFAKDVARTANRCRPRLWRILQPLPSSILSVKERQRRRLGIALLALAVATVVALVLGAGPFIGDGVQPASETADWLREFLGPRSAAVAFFVIVIPTLWWRVLVVGRTVARFVVDPHAARDPMSEVNTQLGDLIQQATRAKRYRRPPGDAQRRFVAFVDNLEPHRAMRSVRPPGNFSGIPTR